MMKKRILSALCAGLMLLGACSVSKPAPQQKDMEQWLKTARLDAKETPKELYEAALKEDTLVIYSVTTRMLDVKESFERAYSGLTVDVRDIRQSDIHKALEENYRNRKYECDIAVFTDSDSELSKNLVPNGILYKYTPFDIKDKLLPGHNGPTLEFLGEAVQLFYNDEVFDNPPVKNWWELTEPRFKGRVWVPSAPRSATTFALIGAMLQKSDEMAKAYKELYGQELEIPAGSSAGQIFWKMLMQNDVHIANSSDEVVEAVGMPGQTNPPVGVMVSSKVRMRDIGYAIRPVYDLAPSAGVYVPNSVMLAGGGKNVNSAKLFIRWLLGEADGQGEGYKPYLQNGTWSVRSDVSSQTPVSLEEAGFWQIDKEYIVKNREAIDEFWLSLQPQK